MTSPSGWPDREYADQQWTKLDEAISQVSIDYADRHGIGTEEAAEDIQFVLDEFREYGFALQATPDPRDTEIATLRAEVAAIKRAWHAVDRHEGITVSADSNGAAAWNTLCLLLAPAARAALNPPAEGKL